MSTEKSHDPFHASLAKRALSHFAIGKLIGGFIGLAFLVIAARLLPTEDYGGYVTLVALLEIVLLVTNLGVYPIAQRYVTEARLPQNLHQLPDIVWYTASYRLATLILASIALAFWGGELFMWMGLNQASHLVKSYAWVIVFEGTARYFDLVFESLLQQALAQISALARNGLRLLLVSGAYWWSGSVSISDVVVVEMVTSASGFMLVAVMTRAYLRKTCPDAEKISASELQWRRMLTFATPLYLANAITQIYSPDAVKFVIARLLGVVEVAAFGLAHSLSAVMQRYLPAQLLLGWLRPMLVSRQASGQTAKQLVETVNLILKVNHFILAPLIVLVTLDADVIVGIIANQKHPGAAPLLVGLVGLLVLQALHVVLSLLATAFEDRRSVLRGTLCSVPGVLIGAALCRTLGALGMVIGLWLSECVYCLVTTWSLRHYGIPFKIDIASWLKIGLAAVAGGAALLVLRQPAGSLLTLLLHSVIIGIGYLAAVFILKPFSPNERATINRYLPRPWFVF
jgi:O-antigen/teichoic acid export membrane protein